MKLTAHDMPASYWRRMAKRNGIRYGTYHRRVTEYGWTPEKAATTPPLHKGSRKADPESTWQKCQRLGLAKATTWRYRQRNPGTTLTDDEIIELALAKREEITLAEKARAAGLKRATVSRRIHKLGWSMEKALSTPVVRPEEAQKMRKVRGWSE